MKAAGVSATAGAGHAGSGGPRPQPPLPAVTPSTGRPAGRSPLEVVPAPAPRAAAPTPPAVAAAARRAAAGRAVKAMLPAFDSAAQAMFARSGVPGAAVAVVAGDSACVRALLRRPPGRRLAAGRPWDGLPARRRLQGIHQRHARVLLVGDRRLGWDTPVHAYWPGFELWEPWVSDHATLRDLLASAAACRRTPGTSCSRSGTAARRCSGGSGTSSRRPASARPTPSRRRCRRRPPVAAEHATGSSWARLVRTRVLEPLGMTSTLLTSAAYAAAPDVAAPHVAIGGVMQAQTPRSQDVLAPALGVSSSIGDLVPYLKMQLNGGALSGVRIAAADALAATLAPTTVEGEDEQGPVAAALGWDVSSFDGATVVAKAGDVAAGSSALVSMAPADGVGIVVLAELVPRGPCLRGRARGDALRPVHPRRGAGGLARRRAAPRRPSPSHRQPPPRPAPGRRACCRRSRRPTRARRAGAARMPASTRSGTTGA